MGENIISWNFTNWLTVFLMAMGGFLVLSLIAQAYHSARGGG